MSPIAIGMNLVLALLLLAALGFGWRLERRLKALRDSQMSFVGAVAELDRAAQRAESGLAELRAATEETVDLLAGRIEKARELAGKLETLTSQAARPVAAAAPVRPVDRTQAPTRRGPLPDDLTGERAEAAAEDLVLRLTERAAPAPERVRLDPRIGVRSRATIDDDLFDSKPRSAVGGRR
jgi:hypothetical protein